MHTLGIDLAAEPKGTALARIHWSANSAQLVELKLGVNDSEIVELAQGATKIGIDCALGWPTQFVEFLKLHSDLNLRSKPSGDINWRRDVSYRETDRFLQRLTGRWPLSVATDRLGMTALRCAGLQARLVGAGFSRDQSGLAEMVEVYPGATLRYWGINTAGYRFDEEIRKKLLSQLLERAPWLELGDFEDNLLSSTDAFDSLIAALSARAAAISKATLPTTTDLINARVEGWIALPTVRVEELV